MTDTPTEALRCDACGRFVSIASLEDGSATRRMVTPDAEGTCEDWETLCAGCAAKENKP